MLKSAYFLRNLQISRVNNYRILRFKNAKFSGYCFYMNTNIYGYFQIYVSVPLSNRTGMKLKNYQIKQALTKVIG